MRNTVLNIHGPKWLRILGRTVALLAVIALCLTGASLKHQYSPREKALYADAATVDFVRPGLVITINSASISSGRRHHRDVHPY